MQISDEKKSLEAQLEYCDKVFMTDFEPGVGETVFRNLAELKVEVLRKLEGDSGLVAEVEELKKELEELKERGRKEEIGRKIGMMEMYIGRPLDFQIWKIFKGK